MNARAGREELRDSLIRALSSQKTATVRNLLGLVDEAPAAVDDAVADAFATLGDAIDKWAELEAIKEVEQMEASREASEAEEKADRANMDYQMRRQEYHLRSFA